MGIALAVSGIATIYTVRRERRAHEEALAMGLRGNPAQLSDGSVTPVVPVAQIFPVDHATVTKYIDLSDITAETDGSYLFVERPPELDEVLTVLESPEDPILAEPDPPRSPLTVVKPSGAHTDQIFPEPPVEDIVLDFEDPTPPPQPPPQHVAPQDQIFPDEQPEQQPTRKCYIVKIPVSDGMYTDRPDSVH